MTLRVDAYRRLEVMEAQAPTTTVQASAFRLRALAWLGAASAAQLLLSLLDHLNQIFSVFADFLILVRNSFLFYFWMILR